MSFFQLRTRLIDVNQSGILLVFATSYSAGPFGGAYFGQAYFGDADGVLGAVVSAFLGELTLLGAG